MRAAGDREGRALRVGAIDVAGKAELGRGKGEHAAELAAAEDADDHARADQRQRQSSSDGTFVDRRRLGHPPAVEAARDLVAEEGEHGGGEEGGVDRAGTADGKRPDRNAGRHLDDRKEAVLPAERLRFDRHAEHRQRRQRGAHAGQMRRAAGAGDDDLVAGPAGAFAEGDQPVRRAVRGDDAVVMARCRANRAYPRRGAASPSPTGCP